MKIIISTIFQDAWDATRAIEIAKWIKQYSPKNFSPEIIFISHGSKFEQKVLDLWFEVKKANPKLAWIWLYEDLWMDDFNLISSVELAQNLLKWEIEVYEELKPDIVLHGFRPIAGLATKMIKKEIPSICFVPLPLVSEFFNYIPDVPEQVKILSIFPKNIRLKLLHLVPKFIKNRIPTLVQKNIKKAAYNLWRNKEKLVNVFDQLKANLTIVNDLPFYYENFKFPKNIVITWPLFSLPNTDENIDPEIENIFWKNISKTKIFCTLSSSGNEKMLKEVLNIFNLPEWKNWNGVILSPHFPIKEAKKIVWNRDWIYITDKFVPAFKINSMADITICHWWQWTLQTAISSGTPIIWVATQQEQFINLAHIEEKNAWIKIPLNKYKTKNIYNAVLKIINDNNYKKSMLNLKNKTKNIDGKKNASLRIWKEIIKNKYF